MNDMDWQQVDQDTIKALTADLEAAYLTINELKYTVASQNSFIASLKQRFADHGIKILEKSLSELTREEIVELNKSIPQVRFERVDNPEKLQRPRILSPEEFDSLETQDHGLKDALSQMVESITEGVDLEKYHIDANTLAFKKGYGPTGKLTLFQKFKRLFT